MGFCVSTASHNWLSSCATHGVDHSPPWRAWAKVEDGPACRGSGRAFGGGFRRTFGFVSSSVASLKHACRDEMDAAFPVCSELKHVQPCPLLVLSHFLRALLRLC